MGSMRLNKKGYPIAVGIYLFVILLTFIIKNDYYFVMLCQISCYYIAALGVNLITGLSGLPNLGAAGVFSLGAYTSALFCLRLGWTPLLAIFPVLFASWCIGKLLGYPSLRIQGVYLSLSTMVFAEVVRILMMNMTELTGGAAGLKGVPVYNLFGFKLLKYNHTVLVYATVALFMSYLSNRIIRSRWGRSFVAIRDNVEAVGSCGIKASYVKVTAFTVCCLFIGVGGAMYGHYARYIAPASFSQVLSSNLVVSLILGGIGTVSGTLAGAVMVTILPEIAKVIGQYYMLAYVTVIMLSIIFVPGGLIPVLFKIKGGITSHDLIKSFLATGKTGGNRND